MPVAREGRGTIAFARDAGEVVEGEADRRFEYVLQVCFESAPVAGEGVYGCGRGRRRQNLRERGAECIGQRL